MIQWFLTQFDTFDLVVLTVAGLVAIYFCFFKNRNDELKKVYHGTNVAPAAAQVAAAASSTSLVSKMKSENRQVCLLYFPNFFIFVFFDFKVKIFRCNCSKFLLFFRNGFRDNS